MENPIEMDDLGVPLFLETKMFLLDVRKTYKISKIGGKETHPSNKNMCKWSR